MGRKKRGRYNSNYIDDMRESLTQEDFRSFRPTKEMWETGNFHQITGFFRDEHSDYQKGSAAENVRL